MSALLATRGGQWPARADRQGAGAKWIASAPWHARRLDKAAPGKRASIKAGILAAAAKLIKEPKAYDGQCRQEATTDSEQRQPWRERESRAPLRRRGCGPSGGRDFWKPRPQPSGRPPKRAQAPEEEEEEEAAEAAPPRKRWRTSSRSSSPGSRQAARMPPRISLQGERLTNQSLWDAIEAQSLTKIARQKLWKFMRNAWRTVERSPWLLSTCERYEEWMKSTMYRVQSSVATCAFEGSEAITEELVTAVARRALGGSGGPQLAAWQPPTTADDRADRAGAVRHEAGPPEPGKVAEPVVEKHAASLAALPAIAGASAGRLAVAPRSSGAPPLAGATAKRRTAWNEWAQLLARTRAALERMDARTARPRATNVLQASSATQDVQPADPAQLGARLADLMPTEEVDWVEDVVGEAPACTGDEVGLPHVRPGAEVAGAILRPDHLGSHWAAASASSAEDWAAASAISAEDMRPAGATPPDAEPVNAEEVGWVEDALGEMPACAGDAAASPHSRQAAEDARATSLPGHLGFSASGATASSVEDMQPGACLAEPMKTEEVDWVEDVLGDIAAVAGDEADLPHTSPGAEDAPPSDAQASGACRVDCIKHEEVQAAEEAADDIDTEAAEDPIGDVAELEDAPPSDAQASGACRVDCIMHEEVQAAEEAADDIDAEAAEDPTGDVAELEEDGTCIEGRPPSPCDAENTSVAHPGHLRSDVAVAAAARASGKGDERHGLEADIGVRVHPGCLDVASAPAFCMEKDSTLEEAIEVSSSDGESEPMDSGAISDPYL